MHEEVQLPSSPEVLPTENAHEFPSTDKKTTLIGSEFAAFAKKVNQLAELVQGQNNSNQLIDHYQLVELIGEGGQGIVFRARDTVLKRDVALKIPHIKKQSDAKLVQRLIREAQTLSQLEQHQHIVPIYDGGEIIGLPYLVCAYCPGGLLTQWLKEHGPSVSVRTAIAWVCQMALAVQHAHEHEIVHRDIKPNNIFISQRPDKAGDDLGLTLMLGDFGLAKVLDENAQEQACTLTQDRLGTPGYMAPEQMLGQHHLLCPATDIYALGVLLYELLTGKVPYSRGTVAWQGLGAPPSLCDYCPAASAELEAICHKCLANEPGNRYSSAAALYHDLQQITKGEPTSVRPATRWTSAWQTILRHKIQITLVACIIGLVTAMFMIRAKDISSAQPIKTLNADCNEVWAVVFPPKNNFLIAAGDSGPLDPTIDVIEKVSVFDVISQKKILTFSTNHVAMIKQIALVDQGETLITSSFDGTVREWNWRTGEARQNQPLIELPPVMENGKKERRAINAMAVSRDEQWIAVASKDYENERSIIIVQHRPTGKKYTLTNTHNCKVTHLVFPEESNPTYLLFTTTMHDELFRWDFTKPAAAAILKLEYAIEHIAFSPKGDRIAFALKNHHIKIFEWPELKKVATLKGHLSDIRKMVYSPNNQWLASVDIDGTVIWWDMSKPISTERARYNREFQIDGLAFSQDAQWLAIGRHDGKVELFSISNVAPLVQQPRAP